MFSRIRIGFVFISSFCLLNLLFAQVSEFTRQDTLRGSITKERKWWDLKYYHLDISVNPDDSAIEGKNTIRYTVLEPYQVMQIDLQPPLIIYKVIQDGNDLEIVHEGNAHFIQLSDKQEIGKVREIEIFYGGKPHLAVNPPWDGGITWQKDKNGFPFIASSCQGIGASIWWPCKDHMYDEPDSMLISVNVPENLTDVSNGRLRRVDKKEDGTAYFSLVCIESDQQLRGEY